MRRWPAYASFRRGPRARSVTADTILARDCELISTTVEQTVILLSVRSRFILQIEPGGHGDLEFAPAATSSSAK